MRTILEIKNPCKENWDKMKMGVDSRFCDNCQKNVIDFTNKNKKEILEYLLTKQNEKVCGRISRSQLDFSNFDLIVTIQAFSKHNKNTNFHFYLLTIGTMFLASCNNSTTDIQNISKTDSAIVLHDTQHIDIDVNIEPKDTVNKIDINKIPLPPVIPYDIINGEIDISHDPFEPYKSVDVMPEFIGGIDSLMSFIRQNIKYPDWEKENKIEGTVLVNFIVDKNGKVKDINILRSVQGSKNFDAEALRVFNIMPDWIPGQENDSNVDVLFNLPIIFEL